MPTPFRFRIYLLTCLVIIGMGALVTRLNEFQMERRNEFLQRVPGTSTVTIREPGIRGPITDRNGIVLAKNTREYQVTFNLEEIAKAYRLQHTVDPKLERIHKRNGLLRKEEQKDIVAIVNEFIIPRLAKYGLARNYSALALRTHYLTHRGLLPFVYRTDLTYDEFAKFAELNLELPGVSISLRPLRQYPYNALASHVIGYLKQWAKGDIPEGSDKNYQHYVGEPSGQAGIEKTLDSYLRGPEGKKTLLRNEKGTIIGVDDYIKPSTGATVKLTLDAHIQFVAENALRRIGRGAAVVMNVETGEVLAMASVPDYNPNLFIPSIRNEDFQAYRKNPSSPFTNRCIASFVPGSTFKLGTAISGALKGVAGKIYSCDGYVTYGNHRIGCWIWNQSKGSHGSEDLSAAIKQSCNPYFNKMANQIGSKAMVEGFSMLGFGEKTGVQLPNESPGLLPGSRTWQKLYPNAKMSADANAQMSIGQGMALATPLQLCSMVACIANGGKYYSPRIVKSVIAANGDVLIPDQPKLKLDLLKEGVKQSDIDLIHKGMRRAANEPGGTATSAKMSNVVIAAKTGTAQVIEHGKKTHNAWTVSFAPFDKPKYAVCVLVQGGTAGGKICAPIVQLLYTALFAQDKGMQLPLLAQTPYEGNQKTISSVPIPKDLLSAINATTPDATAAANAETSPNNETNSVTDEEAADNTDVEPSPQPQPTDPTIEEAPTITPEVDDEGTVIKPKSPTPTPPSNNHP